MSDNTIEKSQNKRLLKPDIVFFPVTDYQRSKVQLFGGLVVFWCFVVRNVTGSITVQWMR